MKINIFPKLTDSPRRTVRPWIPYQYIWCNLDGQHQLIYKYRNKSVLVANIFSFDFEPKKSVFESLRFKIPTIRAKNAFSYVSMVNIAKGIDDCQNIDESSHLFFNYFQFNWCDTFLSAFEPISLMFYINVERF